MKETTPVHWQLSPSAAHTVASYVGGYVGALVGFLVGALVGDGVGDFVGEPDDTRMSSMNAANKS